MARARAFVVLGLGLALEGCQMMPKLPSLPSLPKWLETRTTTVTPLADGQFQVELNASDVRGLGGPRSETLAMHVEQEVAKHGLCKNGTRIVSEWWGSDYYGIKGQCK